jgi:hypothetical protein
MKVRQNVQIAEWPHNLHEHATVLRYTALSVYLAFSTVELRSLFFWDVAACHWIIGDRRFDAAL